MRTQSLLNYLRVQLPDVDVFTQMPTAAWTKPRMLVRRLPGTNTRSSFSTPGLRVVRQGFLLSLWTLDEGTGEDTMAALELDLWNLPGASFTGFGVSDVETDGAQYAPDADTPEGYRHRHLLNVTITGRPTA
jgi:hypothetical protein